MMLAIHRRNPILLLALLMSLLVGGGCGQSPTESTNTDSMGPVESRRSPQGLTTGIIRPLPQPYPDDSLEQAFNKLLSGDYAQATEGAAEILAQDVNLYPAVLTWLTQDIDPSDQYWVDLIIQEYWNSQTKTQMFFGGGENCGFTFEITGNIQIKPGGTVTIETPIEDIEVPVPEGNVPIDTGEIGPGSGSTVTTTTITLDNAPVPISAGLPIPNMIVNGIEVDIETCVTLTITIRYKCDE